MQQANFRTLRKEWGELRPRQVVAFAAEQTSFRNQARRMADDHDQAAGYPIGSGAVERANRQVVGVRVKQAGMRWINRGVRGVLSLRALLRSGRWDAWWDTQPHPIPLTA